MSKIYSAPEWEMRFLALPLDEQNPAYFRSLKRIFAFLLRLNVISPAQGPGGHHRVEFAVFDDFVTSPLVERWLLSNPYFETFGESAPRREKSPNPYIEEEPPDPVESEGPGPLQADEFYLIMRYARHYLPKSHHKEIGLIMRTTVSLLWFYDDVRQMMANTNDVRGANGDLLPIPSDTL